MSIPIYGINPFKTNVTYKSTFYRPTTNDKLPPLPSPFIVVTQDSENDSIITISWDAISGATSYRIMINGVQVDSTTGTNYIYNADKNGVLSIYIRAFGKGFKYSKSNQVDVTVTALSLGVFLSAGLKYILGNLKKILIRK